VHPQTDETTVKKTIEYRKESERRNLSSATLQRNPNGTQRRTNRETRLCRYIERQNSTLETEPNKRIIELHKETPMTHTGVPIKESSLCPYIERCKLNY